MGNNKPFKVKNSVQAPAYHESLGTVETKTGDGWDLSSIVYTGKESYDDLAQYGSYLRSFVFKPDGTKLWAVGAAGTFAGYMYEFDLTTPWDISTLVYASKSFDLDTNGMAGVVTDFVISDDGTKMLLLDSGANYLEEASMNPAWDISTITQVDNVNLSGQETDPRFIIANPDGTRIFYGGTSSDLVREMRLSNGWDLTGQSVFGSLDVSNETAAPESIAFNRDGSKLFLYERTHRKIFTYNLSTPYTMSTATYSGEFIDLASLVPTGFQNGIYCVRFKPDGSQFYVMVQNATLEVQKIYQFSTAKDIYTLDTSTGSVFDVKISNQSEIRIEDRTTWDITATANSSTNWVLTGDHLNGDIKNLSTLGSHIFIEVDDVLRITNNASSSHPFYIKYSQGAGFDDQVIGVTGNGGHSGAVIEWTPNEVGDFYYQCSSHNNMWGEIHVVPKHEDRRFQTRYGVEHTGKTRFDTEITGATQLVGIAVSSDGNHLYAQGGAVLRQYSLSTPYDITTKTYVQSDGGAPEPNGQNRNAIVFSTDGDMYFTVHDNDVIHRIELSTPWDITTASYSNNSIDVSAVTTEAFDFDISRDGKYMYVGEYSSKQINKYYLTTPWDLTTAIRDPNPLGDASFTTGLRGVAVSNDGNHIIATDNNELIWQFDPRVPYGSYNVAAARDLYGGVDLYQSSTAIRIQYSYNGEYVYVVSDASNKFACQYRISGPVSDAEEVKSASVVLSYEEELPSANYDIEDLRFTLKYKDFNTYSDFITGISFKPDGTRMYLASTVGTPAEKIKQYDLSTPWDITSVNTTASATFDISALTTMGNALGLRWTNGWQYSDGTRFWVTGTNGAGTTVVAQFNCSVGWDLSTVGSPTTAAMPSTPADAAFTANSARDIQWNPVGDTFYVLNNAENKIVAFGTNQDFNIGGFTGYANDVLKFGSRQMNTDARSFSFSPDGKYIFIFRYPKVYRYRCETNFTLSTAEYDGVEIDLNEVMQKRYVPSDRFIEEIGNVIFARDTSPIEFSTWAQTVASDGYVYGNIDKSTSPPTIRSLDQLQFSNLQNFQADDVYIERWTNIILPSLLEQPWFTSDFVTVIEEDGLIAADAHTFSPDGSRLYVASQNDKVYQFDVRRKPLVTYGSNIQWRSGYAPTAPEAGETDVLTFTSQNNGLTYEGVLAIDGAK